MAKLLLTDCDGVILNWHKAFAEFLNWRSPNIELDLSRNDMGLEGQDFYTFINEFNTSAAFEFLEPHADAQEVLGSLRKLDYKFVAISTCLGNEQTQIMRELNLRRLFGRDVFHEVICLPVGTSKSQALMRFAPTIYVDDMIKHCSSAINANHRALLMNHSYNQNENLDGATRVSDWHDIYTMIAAQAIISDREV